MADIRVLMHTTVPYLANTSLLTLVLRGIQLEKEAQGKDTKEYTHMQMVLPGLFIGRFLTVVAWEIATDLLRTLYILEPLT